MSLRNRSNARTARPPRSLGGDRPARERRISWRFVLLAAPLAYGAGVLLGALGVIALVHLPASSLLSVLPVVLACPLVSRLVRSLADRLVRPRPLGGRQVIETSATIGGGLLLVSFVLGVGLAALV